MSGDGAVRRAAGFGLRVAVRGRRARGGPWGEAVLAEFAQTSGRWQAVRWAAGGIRTAVRERIRASSRRTRLATAALLTALALAAAGQWVLTPVYHPSPAMEPTIQVGDRWLLDKVSFRLTGLDYGDMVVFEQAVETPDGGPDRIQVSQRVVGLAGDQMSCRDGRLLRDGVPVDEPYARGGTECAPLTVPSGTVYVLGDNRGVARPWDPVAVERIEGRLVTKLW
jgi:signal peptidase I